MATPNVMVTKEGPSQSNTSKRTTRWNLRRNWMLYAMLLPAVIHVLVFSYYPIYGIVIAFQDYQPVHGFWGSPFVGLKWFRVLLETPIFGQVVQNTLIIATAKIVLGEVVAIGFAVLLNEIRHEGYKRSIQTLVYLPNFLSWVIVGGIFINILSTKGPINGMLGWLGFEPIFFLGSNAYFRATLIATEIWKGFGWGAILYLAAITTINPDLYEAAAIDGAGRVKQTRHITLPGMLPTIALLSTLNLANILNAGAEQVLMLYNPIVYQTGDIIDTFVYRTGLIDVQYSLATAVGLGKSLVGLILISISYYLAFKYSDYRIF